MKKLLAILCTIALIATCCAVSFTAFAAETTTATTSPALYNFTTKAETDKWVGLRIIEFNGNTKFEYDAEQQALKVSPKDITKPKACQFTLGMANKTTNVSDYPVIAFKVKANNRTRNTCGIWPGTKVEGRSIYSCGDVCTFYDRTGNWDLIIYDGSNANLAGYEGKWDSIIVRLMNDTDIPNATDYTWIQWAGVFKSVEDVYAYDTSMAPSPFFYDFRDATEGQNLIADGRVYSDGNTNTAISYDANENAVKIASKGTNANRFFFDSKINTTRGATVADVKKYPVFAMKVKFSNPNLNFGGIVPGTCSSAGELCGYVATDTIETGAYQIIVWDGSSYSHNRWNNAWKRVLGALAPNGTTPTTNDCMWVQWAGVFESVEDAYAYDTDCASPYFYNYEDETDIQKLMAKKYIIAENNVAFSYNATEQALEINPTDVGAKSNHRFSVIPTARTTPVADYPVIAIKIKPKNTNHKLGGIAAGTARPAGGSLYASDFQLKGKTLEDGWQIVVFDGTTPPHANYSGNWAGLLIALAPDNSVTTAEDGWYIKWAGVFKTVEDAYAACGTHEYTNACDTACNICNGGTREANHETTKDANITEASYFVAGSKDVVCAECETVIKEGVVIPAAEAALNGDFTETFADGKLTIAWEYSDALALDIANGAVITFNYEIAGYENAVVLDGETGASITLEGFNADRLNADLTYNLSAVYADVDTAKLNAVGGTVKTADIANDEKLDTLLEALEADTVVNGQAENTQWLVSNIAKLDLKAAKAELNVAASQELIDALAAKGGRTDRAVKLIVKIGDNLTKEFEINDLRKYTIVTISGLSFEQLNGDISVQLVFDYANDEYDFATDEIVFACGDMIANANTTATNAFAAYMSK